MEYRATRSRLSGGNPPQNLPRAEPPGGDPGARALCLRLPQRRMARRHAAQIILATAGAECDDWEQATDGHIDTRIGSI